jgi:polygalacturonase
VPTLVILRVVIYLCNKVYLGDDAFAIVDNGENPSENILVRNMTIGTSHGLSVGSWSSGDVRNVTFQYITMNGSDSGTRIKSQRGGGGINFLEICIKLTLLVSPLLLKGGPKYGRVENLLNFFNK